MGYDSSIFSPSNTTNVDPLGSYQKGLTTAVDEQASKLKMSDLANQAVTNQQTFGDQQAQRQAMQNNLTTDANGNTIVDQKAATSQAMQESPTAGYNLQKQFGHNDLDKMAVQTDQAKNIAFSATPENWSDKRQQAIDMGLPNAEKLPDVYVPSFVNNWKMHTLSGEQQIQNEQKERELQIQMNKAYIEQGITPPNQNPGGSAAAQGPNPSSSAPAPAPRVIPGGKRDADAQKAYDDALSSRKLYNPAYATAGSNLLAVKNAMSIFDKHKDLNDLNTQEQHILAGEAAKAIKGGASPTEEEVNALLPGNVNSKGADLWAKISSKPAPTNNADYYQGLKDYFGDLRDNSMNTLKSAHDYAAQTAIARGINPQSLAIKRKAGEQELSDLAYGMNSKGKSTQDDQAALGAAAHPQAKAALSWAQDPQSPGWTQEKADKILQRLNASQVAGK